MDSLKYQHWVKKWDFSNSLYTPGGSRELSRLPSEDVGISGAIGADSLTTRSTPRPSRAAARVSALTVLYKV